MSFSPYDLRSIRIHRQGFLDTSTGGGFETFAFDQIYAAFKAGGFFSNPHFHPITTEVCISIIPMRCKVIASLKDLAAGTESVFDQPAKIAFTRPGRMMDLFKIGRFETVNAHQWNADQPITYVERGMLGGEATRTEPPMWDIAAADGNERWIVYRGHQRRDQVYRLNSALNEFFDHWKSLIKPFEAAIHRLNPESYFEIANYDENDPNRAEMIEVMEEYHQAQLAHPPPWDQ